MNAERQKPKPGYKYETCPRCHRNDLIADDPALNSLSRRDNKTYICNDCGNDEAMIDGGYKDRDDIEMNFLALIESRKEVSP